MVRRSRRNHSPAFKAKVALAAIKGDKTAVELAQQFNVHQTQITQWKTQLLDHAAEAFGSAPRSPGEKDPDLKELHAKIGQQALEIDFLSHALGRIGDPSARR
jgi:transposase